MNMPTKKLPEQTGNSCAAHCTVIAVAELLDVQYLLSKGYAEEILWPSIKFKTNGNPVIDSLAQADNSDPRLIVSETELRWAAAKWSVSQITSWFRRTFSKEVDSQKIPARKGCRYARTEACSLYLP